MAEMDPKKVRHILDVVEEVRTASSSLPKGIRDGLIKRRRQARCSVIMSGRYHRPF